ncbi:CYFA0S11e00870g1_1 [Cyberlindnera fabianii]|uniref:CYFA0S11e00870g1_1 n=1 Tax=Cyberlindnera fabianii TaxID=36022 RepID=A0A061B8C9_CYBFA|nr:CYFA0S11e00870g1_1 [Cyberlindnera fabianii]
MEEKRKRAVIADDDDEDIDVPVAAENADADVEENTTENNNNGDAEPSADADVDDDAEDDGMGDLFGDDDEEDTGAADDGNVDSRPADDDGIVHDSDEEDSDRDQFLVPAEEVKRELRVGELDIVRHPPKFDNKDGDIFTARVPKFLKVDPTRFDGTEYLKHLEQISGQTSEQAELRRLQDENTIRWRFTKQSNESLTAESNAQIVEWEDGSFSLKLGDEYFDVLQSGLKDTYLVTTDDDIKKGEEQVTVPYVSDGAVNKTMKFVPTSTNSAIHKKLTTAIRSRQQTKATTQSVFVDIDPALEAKRLEKEQEDRLREKRRQQLRLEKEQERLGSAGPGATRDTYTPHYSRVHDEYENDDGFIDDGDEDAEEEDDDDALEDVDEDEDDDNEDEDDLAAERLKRVKEAGAAQYQDTEEEVQTRKKRRVIEDDEDDE